MAETSSLWRLAAFAAALGLAACQGTGLSGSPAGVPVSVESIDGPPPAVATAFASALVGAAADRQVDLVALGSPARYRMRGYLSSGTGPDGSPELAFVWDVFDAEKRRARRLAGSSPVATDGDWAALDRDALENLAAKSMDEIALFLAEAKTGTPLAVATQEAAAPAEPGLALAAP